MSHKLPTSSRLCRTRQTKNYLGFSLIEMLVVVVIFAVVGTIVVQMFFSSLKGGSKSNVLAIVKQNGDYALTVMERMIRNSKKVEYCPVVPPDTDRKTLVISDYNGILTTFSCSSNRIASSSGQIYYLTSENVSVSCASLFDCSQFATDRKIGIEFTVSENVPGAKIEEKAQMGFKTTVTLRNY